MNASGFFGILKAYKTPTAVLANSDECREDYNIGMKVIRATKDFAKRYMQKGIKLIQNFKMKLHEKEVRKQINKSSLSNVYH